jgi:hypothetical protein
MSKSRVTDTIPRLHQLVPHMSDFLVRISDGSHTFEDARHGYAETVNRLAAAGLGRRTASRVSDADAYWAPTAELLQEAMRLGFVQRRPLPSSRRHLDSHRNTTFNLTELGREAARLAQNSPAEFTSRLADAAISAHPYLRSFLLLLEEGPLVCPEIREGQIESSSREGRDTRYWASWAADLVNAKAETPVTTAAGVRVEMQQAVTKRFGVNPNPRPTNKALSEALNDAFAAASLRARGLPMGANNLKVLKAWGSQLLLFDQSRYVPAYADCNVVWVASDLLRNNGTIVGATRRGLAQHGTPVARALVDAYRRQAQGRTSELIRMPYLPIHEVRAEAAFDCRVTRALADLVLERLAAGEFAELGVQVWLHLSGGEVPDSEPIYRRGGTRRFSMTVTTTSKEEK